MPAKKKKQQEELALAKFAEREVTQRYINFADWLAEGTGLDLDDVEVPQLLQLGVTLYGKFQKSDVNQTYLKTLKAERKATKKAPAKKAAKAAVVEDDEEEEEEDNVRPMKRTSKKTTAKAKKAAKGKAAPF